MLITNAVIQIYAKYHPNEKLYVELQNSSTYLDVTFFVNVKIMIFLDAMVFNLVNGYQCFEETSCFHHQGRKMGVTILLPDVGRRCC
jgi:hypothetical protein